MNKNDEFLKCYKELEGVLSTHFGGFDSPVLQLENKLNDNDKINKLKLCRNIRNFLQHNNNNNFVCVSDTMINFLEALADEYSNGEDFVKDNMIKIQKGKTIFDIKDKLSDMLNGVLKNGTVLIYDGEKIKGVCDAKKYLTYVNKNKITKTSKVDKCFKSAKFLEVNVHTKTNEAYELLKEGNDVILIVDKNKSKLLGYII